MYIILAFWEHFRPRAAILLASAMWITSSLVLVVANYGLWTWPDVYLLSLYLIGFYKPMGSFSDLVWSCHAQHHFSVAWLHAEYPLLLISAAECVESWENHILSEQGYHPHSLLRKKYFVGTQRLVENITRTVDVFRIYTFVLQYFAFLAEVIYLEKLKRSYVWNWNFRHVCRF